MMFKKIQLVPLAISIMLAPAAISADKQQTLIADAAVSSTAGAAKTLQGSVKATDVEAAECLRQMGECLKKMERAGLDIMGEATRQDYIAVGDPDVVGSIIIPAMPNPSGVMAIGPYLPIRQKWMDYDLEKIGKLIPMYAELTDSLVMPDSVKTQATLILDQMRPLFEDARQKYLTLLGMSQHLKDVKNNDVAMLAVQVHDDMDKMEKLRHDVFKLLKGSEKK